MKENKKINISASCNSRASDGEEVFVYQNTKNLSLRRIQEQHNLLKEYMDANGYWNGGSISISKPMSMAQEHYSDMIRYCHSHGITKIVVAGKRDIGNDTATVRKVLKNLSDNGLSVEIADEGIALAFEKGFEAQSEEDMGEMSMGGM